MNKKQIGVTALIIGSVALSGCASKQLSGTDTSVNAEPSAQTPPNANSECGKANLVDLPDETFKTPPKGTGEKLTLNTNCGQITITTNKAAPKTVSAQLGLAQTGYFDQTICHRITTDGIWIIQCGSRLGTGTDGPGYRLKDENLPVDESSPYKAGTVAMANAGEDSSGSQFFITYKDSPLPPNYTVWGSVDESSIKTIQKVAQAGVVGGGTDGTPEQTLQINSTETTETIEQTPKPTASANKAKQNKKQ